MTNVEVERPELISRNGERVLTARLRDARFFWNADRKTPLEDRIGRLDTILFHKTLGSYRQKAERVERLARWIAVDAFGVAAAAMHAALAGRLAKADLATEMVREFTELQGTMGGIYAREEGQPEEVWKAIYYHYLPVGVEADAPPTREQLGAAAVTWAAVSLADKLDTLVGLFAAGERPTGSRDPYGLRRQAHGIFKILVDLPELTGLASRVALGALVAEAARAFAVGRRRRAALGLSPGAARYVLSQRGYDVRNVRAVLQAAPDASHLNPLTARRMLEALPEFSGHEGIHAAGRRVQAGQEHREGAVGRGLRGRRRRGASARAGADRAGRARAARRARRPSSDHRRRAGVGRRLPARVRGGRWIRSCRRSILHGRVRDGGRPDVAQRAPAAREAARAPHSHARRHIRDCSADGVVDTWRRKL